MTFLIFLSREHILLVSARKLTLECKKLASNSFLHSRRSYWGINSIRSKNFFTGSSAFCQRFSNKLDFLCSVPDLSICMFNNRNIRIISDSRWMSRLSNTHIEKILYIPRQIKVSERSIENAEDLTKQLFGFHRACSVILPSWMERVAQWYSK